MKIKKCRDLFISTFLITSLALGAFIVSCSEEEGLLMGPGNNGIGDPYSTEDTETSAITDMFKSVGEGAAGQVGGDITGWVLGAMGIAGSSGPNYTQQINQIISELDSIAGLLNTADNELNQINQTLNIINCSEQQSSLQTEIGAIREIYNQYNSMMQTARSGDTIPNSIMSDWSDKVLAKNNYSNTNSVGTMLSTIETNLELNTGAVYSCVKTLTLPPENSLNTDTSYYNNVDAITNYYYYWQSIALGMLSEANHYYAWVSAGSPGGSTYSSDSVQAVCGANGTAQFYCNEVQVETNQLYNSLVTQMTYAGAQYTNQNYIFQYSSTNPIVWVRSLEDFTTAAGYSNCVMPLTNNAPCGPAAGYFFSKLSDTTYAGLSGLTFANSTDLVQLIDVNKAGTYSNLYSYLNAEGFNSMANKTVMATDSIIMTPKYSNVQVPVIPFFTSNESVQNMYGQNTAVVSNQSAFIWVYYDKKDGVSDCGMNNYNTLTQYKYYTNSGYQAADYSWIYASGFGTVCDNGTYPDPFHFKPTPPGYTVQAQRDGSAPKRFLWPIVHAKFANCNNGRSEVNAGGMPTMCGSDFTNFLNINVPRPPTCENTKVTPNCINFQ